MKLNEINIRFVCGLALALFPIESAAVTYKISTNNCWEIFSHDLADDASYVPGVDVRGNPLVPADLGGGYGITFPEEVIIDIRLDLAERLGLGGDEGPGADTISALIHGEGVVGRVTVRDNEIYWNDVLIPKASHAALALACQDAFTAEGIPLPIKKPAMQ